MKMQVHILWIHLNNTKRIHHYMQIKSSNIQIYFIWFTASFSISDKQINKARKKYIYLHLLNMMLSTVVWYDWNGSTVSCRKMNKTVIQTYPINRKCRVLFNWRRRAFHYVLSCLTTTVTCYRHAIKSGLAVQVDRIRRVLSIVQCEKISFVSGIRLCNYFRYSYW